MIEPHIIPCNRCNMLGKPFRTARRAFPPKARSKQCLRAVVSWPSSFKPKWIPSCGNTTNQQLPQGRNDPTTRWHPCAQFWFAQFGARMDNSLVQIHLLKDSEIGTTLFLESLRNLHEQVQRYSLDAVSPWWSSTATRRQPGFSTNGAK